MDKILEIYGSVIRKSIENNISKHKIIRPSELNNERFKIRALFIAGIIFLKHNLKNNHKNITSKTNIWLKTTFSDDNLFSSIIGSSNKELINYIDESLSNLKNIYSLNVSIIYEKLLSVQADISNKNIKILSAKNYRNKLGSYYTPIDLAKQVTEKTIDSFFELNYGLKDFSTLNQVDLIGGQKEELIADINTISFADFSCGSGNFIIEIIEYFKKAFIKFKITEQQKSNLLKTIASNISAFDVDCLALEIAKISLLLNINYPSLYKIISENFIHANFLLHSESPSNKKVKRDVFSRGFIYHEQLSLSKAKLNKFDIILGNPPWEKIRFEEKRFFSSYASSITSNHIKSDRINKIKEAELNNPHLADYSTQFKFEIDKAKFNIKQNPFFDLSNNGELNTYALFTDAAIKLKSQRGVFGLVLKSSIVTSQVNGKLFKYLINNNLVISIYDFINNNKIFNIDSRERFCALFVGKSLKEDFYVSMNNIAIDQLHDEASGFYLSNDKLKLLNPLTGMLPNFSNKYECELLLRISNDLPFFNTIFSKVKYGRLVHFTNHSGFISQRKSLSNIPIYEGKYFNQFDSKYSGFNGVDDCLKYGSKSSSILLDESRKKEIDYYPEPRFYIDKKKWEQLSKNYDATFMLALRSLTSATNTRTCIATILPFMPTSQSVLFLITDNDELIYLTGMFNSIIFDFILKKKLSGIDLTKSILNQMPIPDITEISRMITFNNCELPVKSHISRLVLSLLRDDKRLDPLFENLEIINVLVKEKSKFEIIRDIDLLFMFLYKLTEEDLDLVITVFNKQYLKKDIDWFKNELEKLNLDYSINPTKSTTPTLSPV